VSQFTIVVRLNFNEVYEETPEIDLNGEYKDDNELVDDVPVLNIDVDEVPSEEDQPNPREDFDVADHLLLQMNNRAHKAKITTRRDIYFENTFNGRVMNLQPMPDQQLNLYYMSRDGLCAINSVTRQPVDIGQNTRNGCITVIYTKLWTCLW